VEDIVFRQILPWTKIPYTTMQPWKIEGRDDPQIRVSPAYKYHLIVRSDDIEASSLLEAELF
jgi:hypothetical protein